MVVYNLNYFSGIRVSGGTGSTEPSVGGPFSAITPSMWPQDILTRLSQQVTHQDPNHQPDYR